MSKEKGNILIVEDQPELLIGYKRIIEKLGYNTLTAENGKEALEAIEKHKIDLILLDVILPDINGFKVLVDIKSNPKTEHVFVVLISSKVKSPEKQAEALNSGADGYLVKPVESNELAARIKSFMKHKITIDELRSSEERFRKITEKTLDGILIVDKNGSIHFSNPAAQNLFDKSKDDLKNSEFGFPLVSGEKTEVDIKQKNSFNIIAEMRATDIEWSSQKMFLAALRDITARKNHEQEIQNAYKLSVELNRKYLLLNKQLEEKTGKLAKTNTALKQAKDESEKSEQKFRSIIESINDGFFVLSGNDFTILHFNKVAAKIMHCQVENVLGKKFFTIFPKLKESIFKEKFTECMENNTFVQFETYIDKKPYKNWFGARVYPGEQGSSVFIEIITAKKNAEKELIEAKNKAEESDQLKTAFLQNMSHEIRSPMNAIVGFSEIVLRESLNEDEKKQYAQFIRSNSESLTTIIDDIIDISKLQSNQITIKNNNFDLSPLLKELYLNYEHILQQKPDNKLTLALDTPLHKDEAFGIYGDRSRLKQVLNNLINNAIKYAKYGEIKFGFKINNNELYFFVKDSGQGIPKAKQSEIFNRFIQVSNEYVARSDGTGLGLPIAKELIHLMGGELLLESAPNKGALFYFNLPYKKSNETNTKAEQSISPKNTNLTKFNIIVADDEESNYILTKRILKPTGVKTQWAPNGQKAVELIEKGSVDLVIMDIKMPVMDGIEATRIIKSKHPNLPVIMQTAYAMSEVQEEARNAQCDDFIAKPISIDKFTKLVNKFLK